jgi:acyl carrier protein phosphodiesterase
VNYLGHAYLSFGDALTLTGNMIGDHVKGTKALAQFPEAVQKGIRLHRAIDSFTDGHPAIAGVKTIFREDYGLYAGALADTLIDYFLANDTSIFPGRGELLLFTQDTYRLMDSCSAYFPVSFTAYFALMKQYNWLYHCHTKEGIYKSLQGLYRRAAHMRDPDRAFALFTSEEALLQTYYHSFIHEVISFVKIESARD